MVHTSPTLHIGAAPDIFDGVLLGWIRHQTVLDGKGRGCQACDCRCLQKQSMSEATIDPDRIPVSQEEVVEANNSCTDMIV